ncbi:MAG: transposase [Deltaproteobacteria bacterium]|nr:transposase [Deltaproteobacteria bacterium]MBW2308996.1 transposase [Deltaproteobacteria bacterium]
MGFMMEGERKSVEPMSERVHASERGMQRLLTEVKWDYEGVFSVLALRDAVVYSPLLGQSGISPLRFDARQDVHASGSPLP